MNSKQRMSAAMRFQRPDKTPVMCQLALGHYFLQTGIPDSEIWHSTEGFGEALIMLQRRYQFDGILINLPGRDPDWRSSINRIEQTADGKIIHWRNGWLTVCPPDDNPHVYRQAGSRFHADFADVAPEKLFYIEPHDLSGITYPYAWSFSGEIAQSEDFFPPWHFATIDYVISRVGHDVSVHGEIFSPFTQFLELFDYTNGLLALMDDPGKSKACLEALAGGAIALGREQAAHGVDAIVLSSALASGGFISPSHYREFVLPYEKMVIEGIKAVYDIPVYTHTCGSIGDRLELMAQTGTNGIDTLDPPPLGDVELADAKHRIGHRMFIKGNLDPVNIIQNATPEAVFAEATRCLQIASPGSGYVLSSACSIPPHAPPDNIMQIVRAREAFTSMEKGVRL